MAPRPIATVRYGDANGSTVAAQPIVTYGSLIAVATCSPRKETENSASVRCNSPSASRDQRLGAEPSLAATPRTTVALNAASSASPLARETNHRACDPVKASAGLIVRLPAGALPRTRDHLGEPVGAARGRLASRPESGSLRRGR